MAGRSSLDRFDVETLAARVVARLAPSPGQVISIWASDYSLDLIEALAFHLRARGVFWTLRLTTEALLGRIGRELPEPYLGMIPEHELRWLADVDAIVEVRDHGSHLPGVPLPRRRAMGAEWIALIDAADRRGLRRLRVVNPTPALAAAYDLSWSRLSELYWRAVNVDDDALDRRGLELSNRLARADKVHVTSPLGTDLHLRVAGRPVLLDDDSIPRGEVYLAPHEDAAQGVAVIDRAFIRGNYIDGLRLTFAGGRVVEVTAPVADHARVLEELLAASTGDRDVIGEFAIGLNPGVTGPVGDVALDEKIGGSVHIALGMNQAFGGRNRSNLHLDLVILHPTVRLDGETILDSGVFC